MRDIFGLSHRLVQDIEEDESVTISWIGICNQGKPGIPAAAPPPPPSPFGYRKKCV